MKIEIFELNKRYGKSRVLHDVTLSIPPGCAYALLGPNGSGKTTLIKSLLGLVLPENPEAIAIDGAQYPAACRSFVLRTGYMPQIPDFPEHLRVSELALLLEELAGYAAPNAPELMEELRINRFSHKKLGELSQGMRQKVNILQALMYEREFYILDEPTASLDPMNAYYLKTKIRQLRAQGRTVLFTSHVMKEVEELADELCLLVDGRSIVKGRQSEIVKPGLGLEESIVALWRDHEQKLHLDHT